MVTYTTSLPRAALGIAAGVITGAALVTLWDRVGVSGIHEYWLRDALFIFTYAAVVWAAGVLVVALVPWAFLHHYGLRGWPVAVTLGAVLTFIVVCGFLTNGFGAYVASGNFSAADNGGPTWVSGRLTSHGWGEAIRFAAICSAMGAVVGLVVWRTAYRRVPDGE